MRAVLEAVADFLSKHGAAEEAASALCMYLLHHFICQQLTISQIAVYV